MKAEFFLQNQHNNTAMLITLESPEEISGVYAALKLVDAEIQSTPLLRKMISTLESGMMYSPKITHHAEQRITQ